DRVVGLLQVAVSRTAEGLDSIERGQRWATEAGYEPEAAIAERQAGEVRSWMAQRGRRPDALMAALRVAASPLAGGDDVASIQRAAATELTTRELEVLRRLAEG